MLSYIIMSPLSRIVNCTLVFTFGSDSIRSSCSLPLADRPSWNILMFVSLAVANSSAVLFITWLRGKTILDWPKRQDSRIVDLLTTKTWINIWKTFFVKHRETVYRFLHFLWFLWVEIDIYAYYLTYMLMHYFPEQNQTSPKMMFTLTMLEFSPQSTCILHFRPFFIGCKRAYHLCQPTWWLKLGPRKKYHRIRVYVVAWC